MNALSFSDTKKLIDLVLSQSAELARDELHVELTELGLNEGLFYAGIVRHAPGLRLTTDQWFELLCRLPNRVLRSDLNLSGLLSEEHLKRRPPVTG